MSHVLSRRFTHSVLNTTRSSGAIHYREKTNECLYRGCHSKWLNMDPESEEPKNLKDALFGEAVQFTTSFAQKNMNHVPSFGVIEADPKRRYGHGLSLFAGNKVSARKGYAWSFLEAGHTIPKDFVIAQDEPDKDCNNHRILTNERIMTYQEYNNALSEFAAEPWQFVMMIPSHRSIRYPALESAKKGSQLIQLHEIPVEQRGSTISDMIKLAAQGHYSKFHKSMMINPKFKNRLDILPSLYDDKSSIEALVANVMFTDAYDPTICDAIMEVNPQIFDKPRNINPHYITEHKNRDICLKIPEIFPPHLIIKDEPFMARLPPFVDKRYLLIQLGFRGLEADLKECNDRGIDDSTSHQVANTLDILYHKLWQIFDDFVDQQTMYFEDNLEKPIFWMDRYGEALAGFDDKAFELGSETTVPGEGNLIFSDILEQIIVIDHFLERVFPNAPIDESLPFDFTENELNFIMAGVRQLISNCWWHLEESIELFKPKMSAQQIEVATALDYQCGQWDGERIGPICRETFSV